MQLPTELVEEIYCSLPFEKVILISDYAANKIYDHKSHSCDWAAENGHLEVIKWLYKNCKEFRGHNHVFLAAKNGHLEVIKWFHENYDNLRNNENITCEVKDGEICIPLMLWMMVTYDFGGIVWSASNMDVAAENGQLEVVKWLHENRTEGCTEKAMGWAAYNGHLEVVKWLYENDAESRKKSCTTNSIICAYNGDHFDIANWLQENRPEGSLKLVFASKST